MKNFPVLKIFLVFFFTAAFSASHAAPVVDKIERAESTASITLVGKDFGDFGGEIVSWDDFENHEVSQKISGLHPIEGHTWNTIYGYNGSGISIDSKNSASGSKSVKIDWTIDPEGIRAFGWAGKGPYKELYISYWRMMTGNFLASTSNHKQFYLYGNKSGFPQGMPFIPAGQTSWGFYNNVSSGAITALNPNPNNKNEKGWAWDNTSEKLQRWEFYVKLNEPYTESNGIIQAWLDGSKGIDNRAYKVRNVDGEFNDFRLGHMAGGFFNSAKAWFDDIYIATTQARIELCNSSVYESCTVKHLQYIDPENWSDSSITFHIRNLASFRGEPVYLFVIDKNGTPSNPVSLSRPLPPYIQ